MKWKNIKENYHIKYEKYFSLVTTSKYKISKLIMNENYYLYYFDYKLIEEKENLNLFELSFNIVKTKKKQSKYKFFIKDFDNGQTLVFVENNFEKYKFKGKIINDFSKYIINGHEIKLIIEVLK